MSFILLTGTIKNTNKSYEMITFTITTLQKYIRTIVIDRYSLDLRIVIFHDIASSCISNQAMESTKSAI